MIMAGKMMGGENIPRNGLVLEYLFKGNSLDTSGMANDGTLGGTNIPTYSIGRKGDANGAILFNNGKVTSIANVPLSGTNKISCSFWLYDTGNSIGILSISSHFLLNGFDILKNNNDKMSLLGHPGGGTFFNWIETVSTQTRMQWHHIVINNDRALSQANEVSIYINGGLVNVQTITGYDYAIITNFSNYPAYIGNVRGLDGYALYGKLSELRLYNRLLTTDEITQLYNE